MIFLYKKKIFSYLSYGSAIFFFCNIIKSDTKLANIGCNIYATTEIYQNDLFDFQETWLKLDRALIWRQVKKNKVRLQ